MAVVTSLAGPPVTAAYPGNFQDLVASPARAAMQVALVSNPACAPAQPTRRQAASSSVLAPNESRLVAQVAARASQRGVARQRGASLRVLATSAPPAAQAGAKAAGGDSGVYDVVVVGAGISGLTTAQVRRRRSGACEPSLALL